MLSYMSVVAFHHFAINFFMNSRNCASKIPTKTDVMSKKKLIVKNSSRVVALFMSCHVTTFVV